MRSRSASPWSLLAASVLASALLLAGPIRFSSAQAPPDVEIQLDYNNDDIIGVDQGYPGGYPGGYTGSFRNTNVDPNLVYLASDPSVLPQFVRGFPALPLPAPTQTGAGMIVRAQDDPILIWSLSVTNRTDVYGTGFNFDSLTLQLPATTSAPGQLPFLFLADTDSPTPPMSFPGTGSDVFASFSLSTDRRTLTFFNPIRGAVAPTDTVLLNFRMSAPKDPTIANPSAAPLMMSILPNFDPSVPEPGTVALIAVGLPVMAGFAARRRRKR